MRKANALLSAAAALLLAVSLPAMPAAQQGSMASPSAQANRTQGKERWEGIIVRSSKDKKLLTVRQRSSGLERLVTYDDSTEWTSQVHHSKKVNVIDASQVKDNDRVICLGKFDKNGVLHAALISKRLPE